MEVQFPILIRAKMERKIKIREALMISTMPVHGGGTNPHRNRAAVERPCGIRWHSLRIEARRCKANMISSCP
jgi:hypothetical protein